MSTLAINSVSSPPGPATARIVAAIVRALRGDAQSIATGTTGTGTEDVQARLSSILNLLLNPKNGAALMDINLDQLVNNSALQNLIRQLPPELFSKPQIFEVLVLQNTLLPNVPTQENAPALPTLLVPQTANAALVSAVAPALYRITLQWQNRLLQILSPQPFPRGAQLQLQSNARGEIVLLSTSANSATTVARAQNALPETALQSSINQTAPTTTPSPLQTLQQSARELLPRQQALHTLVPLLQKFLQPATQAQLPQPIAKAVTQLLQSLPHAEQVQNPAALRQAVENSGSFFEGRLAREPANTDQASAALAKIISADTKAQLSTLLEVIRKLAPNAAPQTRAPSQTDTDEFVYSHKPIAPAPHAATPNASGDTQTDTLDSLLSQLGKLLQAGLARIQLNQLDSASARQVGNDAQPPIPTWIVEVPLRTPYGADQLQVRIEQRHKKQAQRARVQWNVHIALDLHAAGKLTAALTIVDKSIAATLWAEREQTHRAVRDEMDYLRAGLESVGVTVTEMQCRHGVPPARTSALTQRLVDVHT